MTKLCINCYTENPSDAVLCSECGMSLTRAPTGEEAVKLREAFEAQSRGREEAEVQPQRPTSMLNIWFRAVTDPVLATYEDLLREEPNPTLSTAVGWIALAGLINGALSGLLNLLFGMARGQSAGMLFMLWVIILILGPVVSVIAFVIGSAIWLAVARAFGGDGDLASQSYLLAAAQAPLSIVSSSLAMIPCFGTVLALLAVLYGIYLQVLALRAAHRFGWGKAVGTLLIPMAVGGALYCICLFAIVAANLGDIYG